MERPPVLPGLPPGYTVGRRLGSDESAMWQATDDSTGRAVTLRHIAVATPALRERLHAGTSLMKAIDHPHIVPLLDAVDVPSGVMIVCGAAEGGSLADAVAVRGTLPAGEVVTACAPIAEALAEIHPHGILHGAITLDDVVFSLEGRPMLAGVGMIQLGAPALRGRHGTLAPEIAGGSPPSPGSDVFGLAAVAIVGLTGYLPRLPLSLPDVPPSIGAALARALERAPERRLDAATLSNALYALADPEPVEIVVSETEVTATGSVPVITAAPSSEPEPELPPSAPDAAADEVSGFMRGAGRASGRGGGGRRRRSEPEPPPREATPPREALPSRGDVAGAGGRPEPMSPTRPAGGMSAGAAGGLTGGMAGGMAGGAAGGPPGGRPSGPPAGLAGGEDAGPARGRPGRRAAGSDRQGDRRPVSSRESGRPEGASDTGTRTPSRSPRAPKTDAKSGPKQKPRGLRRVDIARIAMVLAILLLVAGAVVVVRQFMGSDDTLPDAGSGSPSGDAEAPVDLCGGPQPAPTATPAAVTDWTQEVQRLYSLREQAFEELDAQLLCQVHSPTNTVLATDVETLQAWSDAGIRADGLTMEVVTAELVSQQAGKVVLDITERVQPYDLVDEDGEVVERKEGTPENTWRAELVAVADEGNPVPTWRFG